MKQFAFIVLFFLCVSVQSSPCQVQDSLPYVEQITRFRKSGNKDSLVYYQSRLISFYQGEISSIHDAEQRKLAGKERMRDILLIEWGCLGLLLVSVVVAVVLYFYRKRMEAKGRYALLQMKFSLYIKRLVSQKDLLSLDEEVSPLLQKHLRAEVDDTNRAIEQMKSGLSEAELEQMLVAQAQQLEVVKHFLNLAANDSRPVPDDWTMLHDGLHVIYDHAVTFLDGKRKDLLEEVIGCVCLSWRAFFPNRWFDYFVARLRKYPCSESGTWLLSSTSKENLLISTAGCGACSAYMVMQVLVLCPISFTILSQTPFQHPCERIVKGFMGNDSRLTPNFAA